MAYVSAYAPIPADKAEPKRGFFLRVLARMMDAREAEARRHIAMMVSPELAEGILTKEIAASDELLKTFFVKE